MTLATPDRPLVIVAHPDDEILWLGAVLPSASRIVAALAGDSVNARLAEARLRVRDAYPIDSFEYLDLESAGVFQQSDWLRRRITTDGVTMRRDCPPDASARYRANYTALLDALDAPVRAHPVIYSHNRWGEYGHEEHVQVCQAVIELAQRHGCSVWAWDGFSSRWQLAMHVRLRADYFPDARVTALPVVEHAVDLDLFREIRALYQAQGAWTWNPWYLPPSPSRYLQLVRDGDLLLRARRRPRAVDARIATRAVARRAVHGVRAARRRLGAATRH
jgi:hypothetical protein